LIGYSGHAFVAHGILTAMGRKVVSYCDSERKAGNPFNLDYLGTEHSPEALSAFQSHDVFIGIGNNTIRRKIQGNLLLAGISPVAAIHPSLILAASAKMSTAGIMISAGVIVNPLALVGDGVILNTGCIVEHECRIADFAHIGPGAVLCGNVTVGENSFVGAGSVVRQGIVIGANAMIGAGSVVVKDVPDNATIAGNPARIMLPR
jgi:sugar O-acyltransferase (sialic acid O-acetyltransferase NeuD family)